jgi:hypothetical protein
MHKTRLMNRFPRVSEDAKHFALSWLGECLAANSGRGQMWTSQMGPLLAANYASDGFMLNLGSTLLRHNPPSLFINSQCCGSVCF